MERAVKERLIGASLLILAAVVIVPWLLDGAGPNTNNRPVESLDLQLPGADRSQNETRTIVLDGTVPGGSGISRGAPQIIEPARNPPNNSAPDTNPGTADRETPKAAAVDSPPSVNATVPATEPADTPRPAQSAPAPPPEVFTQPQPATPKPVTSGTPATPASEAPAGAAWAVQVGSFALQENAERLSDRLKNKDYSAFVMRNVVDGRVRYRVRVGPMASREEADKRAAELRDDRQPARVVPHP